MTLKTTIRINEDNIRCEKGETVRDAVKRMALTQFHTYYPDEVTRGCGIVEIDAVHRQITVLVVWD